MGKRTTNPDGPFQIRHVLPQVGMVPLDRSTEAASGLVGAALAIGAEQARAGHQVSVMGWRDDVSKTSTRDGLTIWTHRGWRWAKAARWDLRWLAPVAVRTLLWPYVDVLHAHMDPNLLYLPKARVHVLHLHTPVPDPFPAAYRRLLRRADSILCCSDFIRSRFLSLSGFAPEKAHTVYNGVDLARFSTADRTAKRREWGLEPSDLALLYVGAINPLKGVEYLLQAFRQLSDKRANLHLLIVGGSGLWSGLGISSNHLQEYEKKLHQTARGLRVTFCGVLPQAEMPDMYAASDLVAVPSTWDEPSPLVVYEAMAAGRPVIATRTGGLPEIVADGETGILVPAADAQALADAIGKLVCGDGLRERLGKRALARSAQFTWKRTQEKLDSIYSQALSQRRER